MKSERVSPLILKYQRLYDKDPRSRVFAPLAEGYRKLGMVEKAISILKQGIRYNPSYIVGYVSLAYCYFDLKEYQLAYTTLRPSIAEQRENLKMQKLFAENCLLLGHENEAIETYKYLLFVNPRDQDAAMIVKRLESSKTVDANTILDQAQIDEDAIQEDKMLFDETLLETNLTEDEDYWKQVDFFTAAKKQITELENVIQRSETLPRKQDLDSATSYDSWVSKDLSEIKQEEATLVKEEVDSPVDDAAPLVTHTLIDLYCSQGHVGKAIEILEKIIELNPQDRRSVDKLSDLRKMENSIAGEKRDRETQSKSIINYSAPVDEEGGRQSLMDIIDQKIVSKKERNFDLVIEKLWRFHTGLIERSKLKSQYKVSE